MIDYAHNAVALESILNTLRAYDPPRLISYLDVAETVPKTEDSRWVKYPEDWQT